MVASGWSAFQVMRRVQHLVPLALGAQVSLVATAASAEAPPSALSPKEFRAFTVIDRKQITPDTYQLRFALPPGTTAGLPVASCLVTKAELPGEAKPVIRPYTPTSSKDAVGYLDLVVKAYPTGLLSKHIGNLQIGDTLEMKGPIQKLSITPNLKKHIAMIAGGSGITPMIQVIEEILGNPEDKTEISLIFGNNTEQDIILRDRLERLAQRFPGRFKVWFVLAKGKFSGSDLPKGVVRSVGLINKDIIQGFVPGPKEDVLVLVCGPPGMMQAISGPKAPDYSQGEVGGVLKELGFTKDQVYKF